MKLVILDRDGVINEDSNEFIKTREEWVPIDGSIEAIARLTKAGFCVVVATNQSGLGRGIFGPDELEAMHEKMQELVSAAGGEIAGVFYCPHHPDDDCDCRKPKAGLLDAIERAFTTSVQGAAVIGDSLRDLQAGMSKGCRPILVKTGKGQKTLSELEQSPNNALKDLQIFDNLANAADHLISS